jgi:deoxyribonucleoside regulator
MSYDLKIMAKAAYMYYKEKLSQVEIAERLKVSKYQVIRLIQMAEKNELVQITIIDPDANASSYEKELERKYQLSGAIVVENKGLSDQELKSKLGQAAAKYLLNAIKDGDVIGISWGSTINEMVASLPQKTTRSIRVVQLIGANHQMSTQLSSHDIARRFAQKFGVEPHLLFGPAIVINRETRDVFVSDRSIKRVFDLFKKTTVAIFGIGTPESEGFKNSEYINKTDIRAIMKCRPVGDVINHFYDVSGKLCRYNLEDRLIAIPVEDLLEVPYRLAIAGGLNKVEAILGAIRGKFANILITDTTVAEKLTEASL